MAYAVKTPDDRHTLVMIPDSGFDPAQAVTRRYPKAGMYRAGEPPDLLWLAPWYHPDSRTLVLFNGGEHVALIAGGHLTVWSRGRPVGRHDLARLDKRALSLEHLFVRAHDRDHKLEVLLGGHWGVLDMRTGLLVDRLDEVWLTLIVILWGAAVCVLIARRLMYGRAPLTPVGALVALGVLASAIGVVAS